MPKVSRYYASSRTEIRFIDGFSGPGEYTDGEAGSPVIAAAAAIKHTQSFPIPVRATFIDNRKDRVEHLRGVLGTRLPSGPHPGNIVTDEPICGDCAEVLGGLMSQAGSGRNDFGPALAFLDQFGYGQVPMDLIGQLLRYQSSEVFTYLNFDHLNRFLSDASKWPSIDLAWGGEEWRPAMEMEGRDRENHLRDTYKAALSDRASAPHICYFTMHDEDDNLLYWLFFCSGSIHGLYEMKRSMWNVDASGSFHFSDRHAGQPSLLTFFGQEWLAAALSQELAGRTLTVGEVKKFVLRETPCYIYKEALRLLEKQGGAEPVNPPDERRKGTFASENMKIRFSQSS